MTDGAESLLRLEAFMPVPTRFVLDYFHVLDRAQIQWVEEGAEPVRWLHQPSGQEAVKREATSSSFERGRPISFQLRQPLDLRRVERGFTLVGCYRIRRLIRNQEGF